MKSFGLSDIGKKRKENQDAFAVKLLNEKTAVLVVCDGMGGMVGGKIAGETARDAFLASVSAALEANARCPLPETAKAAAEAANLAVWEKSKEDPSLRGMGTTLVGAIARGGKTVIVNIGDSRAYAIGMRKISRITKDHSVVWELVEAGKITEEEARVHPKRNYITRAVGIRKSVEVDVFVPRLSPGQCLLLCSDGICGLLEENEIQAAFKSCKKSPEQLCTALIDLALSRGAPDNATVVAMQL